MVTVAVKTESTAHGCLELVSTWIVRRENGETWMVDGLGLVISILQSRERERERGNCAFSVTFRRARVRLICRIGSRKEVDLNSTYDESVRMILALIHAYGVKTRKRSIRGWLWRGIVNRVDVKMKECSWNGSLIWKIFIFWDCLCSIFDRFSLRKYKKKYLHS